MWNPFWFFFLFLFFHFFLWLIVNLNTPWVIHNILLHGILLHYICSNDKLNIWLRNMVEKFLDWWTGNIVSFLEIEYFLKEIIASRQWDPLKIQTSGKEKRKEQQQMRRDNHSDMSKMLLLAYKRIIKHWRKNGEGCLKIKKKGARRKKNDKGRTKAPKRNFCPRT